MTRRVAAGTRSSQTTADRRPLGWGRYALPRMLALAYAWRLSIDVELFAFADGFTAFDRVDASSIIGRAVLFP